MDFTSPAPSQPLASVSGIGQGNRTSAEGLRREAFTHIPIAEVYAVSVLRAQQHKRDPFSSFLYQARMYKHFVDDRFEDRVVPEFMRDVGSLERPAVHTRQVFCGTHVSSQSLSSHRSPLLVYVIYSCGTTCCSE